MSLSIHLPSDGRAPYLFWGEREETGPSHFTLDCQSLAHACQIESTRERLVRKGHFQVHGGWLPSSTVWAVIAHEPRTMAPGTAPAAISHLPQGAHA